jgi:hypothetical protein
MAPSWPHSSQSALHTAFCCKFYSGIKALVSNHFAIFSRVRKVSAKHVFCPLAYPIVPERAPRAPAAAPRAFTPSPRRDDRRVLVVGRRLRTTNGVLVCERMART